MGNKIINKSKSAKYLNPVYKDLLHIKIKPSDTFKSLLKKFYKVMEKHGICEGEWSKGGGRTVANYEWSMFSGCSIDNH